jgi:hypothetical protein
MLLFVVIPMMMMIIMMMYKRIDREGNSGPGNVIKLLEGLSSNGIYCSQEKEINISMPLDYLARACEIRAGPNSQIGAGYASKIEITSGKGPRLDHTIS